MLSALTDPRCHQILRTLRVGGPHSRQELHTKLGVRPNTVSHLAEQLIDLKLLREGRPLANGPGRPKTPLEIDPTQRSVLGLSLQAGRVVARRLNLQGERLGTLVDRPATTKNAVEVAAETLRDLDPQDALAIGISTTGCIDPTRQTLLISSATGGGDPVSLAPLLKAAGDRPTFIENDMQAMAIRWNMSSLAGDNEDIMLVYLRDGAVGAAILVNGRPIRGCVVGGNELGHTRLPIDSPRCLCGHTGCLETIFSSAYLKTKKINGSPAKLADAIAEYRPADQPLSHIIDCLAISMANAVNLLRPQRLVLASEFNRHTRFTNDLLSRVRESVLPSLSDRVRMDLWDQDEVDFAESAGWLALALVYQPEIAAITA